MTDTDELERSVIEAARRGFAPPADVGARVRSRAFSAIALGTVVPLPTEGLLSRARNGLLDTLEALRAGPARARLLMGALALSGVGIGGYALGLRAGRAEAQAGRAVVSTAPRALPAPVQLAASSAESSEPLPPQAGNAASRLQSRAHAPPELAANVAPSSIPVDADAELRALRRVERVLREHNPRLAVALLNELDREVPRGKLAEERDAARSIAACELESAASVTARTASEFAERHPGSVYLPRVARACAPQPPAAERNERASETHTKQ
ncbi:MAG TPA: hypothetical protein VEQ58_06455 [Polyangiaceae bacterium]|nr:hypothetical protein [Polyangiaceae bacterium]